MRALLAAAGLTLALAAPACAASLPLGFSDPTVEKMSDTGDLATAFQHARDASATVWGFQLRWSTVSPTKPASPAEAADPNWSGYDWSYPDRMIRLATVAGLRPLPVVMRAPAWAEGAHRPAVSVTAPAGTWRPSPGWYRAFATALARRYSGAHPDPEVPGTTLPRVTTWTAWNEPNLSTYLSPQWVRSKGRWKTASPAIYRRLLNVFYAGIKAVAPDDTVVTAGTAPYGDLHPGDPRLMPLHFWRDLLCVRGRAHPVARHCRANVRFDVISHHPYPIGPPTRHARNADDVVIPDLRKITRVLKVAQKAGTVVPQGPKPLWVTETSWDSYPDPDGLSLARQARYLEGALYVFWRQGVSLIAWYHLRDDPKGAGWDRTYQSGIFMNGPTVAEDVRKPSFTAFRFPFTAYRQRGVAQLWGIAPTAGRVKVQVRSGNSWRTVARLRTRAGRMFRGRLLVGRNTTLRAVSGPDTSLTWKT